MKKLLSIIIIFISVSAFASGYVSSDGYQSSSNNSGYQTSSNNDGYQTSSNSSDGYQTSTNERSSETFQKRSHNHRKKLKFSVFVNMPQYQLVQRRVYFPSHPHRHLINYIQWVNSHNGYPVPQDAVVGGAESYGENLFICHGYYNGDLHPGKVVDGSCHISWGGHEIVLGQYSTLVSPFALSWVQANQGYIPSNAIEGGYENGHPLYICQANYNGATHPGKIVGNACNIAWGGQEIAIPTYNVLVRA